MDPAIESGGPYPICAIEYGPPIENGPQVSILYMCYGVRPPVENGPRVVLLT